MTATIAIAPTDAPMAIPTIAPVDNIEEEAGSNVAVVVLVDVVVTVVVDVLVAVVVVIGSKTRNY